MTKRNEVLDTCGVEMGLELGAARPDLDFHLSKVTADGLTALIDAQQDRCQEELRLSLEKLNDPDLALKCAAASWTCPHARVAGGTHRVRSTRGADRGTSGTLRKERFRQ